MGFSLAPFKRGLPLAAIASLAVYPALAQRSVFRGGQPIVFSSPTGEPLLSNTPSLSPRPPESLDLSDAAQAPLLMNFSRLPDTESLPSVMPLRMPGETERERELDDRRRNWALLTPAEILGVVTPEQVLGVTERDAFGQPKYQTALERYADRQNRRLLASTNGPPAGNAPPAWYSPDGQQGDPKFLFGTREMPDGQKKSRFYPTPNNPLSAQPNDNSSWARLFDPTPTATTPAAFTPAAPNPDHLDDMERFRQLLNSGSPSVAAAAAPVAGGLKTSLPQALLGTGLAQAQSTPLGSPVSPVMSGIGRPAGLPKLTPGWTLSYTSPPPAEAWMPQPAPRLSPLPQPFTAPQRKF